YLYALSLHDALPILLLEPFPPGSRPGLRHQLGAADDLPLVDLLDVDAERRQPLVGIGDRGVHAHRTSTEATERAAPQAADGLGRSEEHTSELQSRGK